MADKSLKDFIPDKSKISPAIIRMMREAGDMDDLANELEESLTSSNTQRCLKQFITQEPRMLRLKKHIEKLAAEVDPVLITGESGTGKELIAKALHGERKGHFVTINCAGIPENLLESELFGHVKGAFTGAFDPKKGLFTVAENGTIFLDEIGEMPLSMQSKLLRALQEKRIRAIGATTELEINCRFISATNRDLNDDVRIGNFRNDLYWRINTFSLETLPLRLRTNDIPLLIKHLDTNNCIKNLEEFCRRIDKDLLTGNVRTLDQMVRRYCVLGLWPHEKI